MIFLVILWHKLQFFFGYADSIMPNRQCNKCEQIDKMLTGTKLFPVQRNGMKIFHLNNDSLCHRFWLSQQFIDWIYVMWCSSFKATNINTVYLGENLIKIAICLYDSSNACSKVFITINTHVDNKIFSIIFFFFFQDIKLHSSNI